MNITDYLKLEIFPEEKNIIKKFIKLHFNESVRAVYLIRKAQVVIKKKGFLWKIIALNTRKKLIRNYGIFIGRNTEIGIGLRLPHPNGIIIGDAVKIKGNCTIFQQVTIGSRNRGDSKKGKQPEVGNNCVFFAGSKIIGSIVLEDNVIVGSNSVLNKNAVSGVYVGCPAKRLDK